MHFAKAPLQEDKPNTPIYHNPSDFFFYLRACHFDGDEVYWIPAMWSFIPSCCLWQTSGDTFNIQQKMKFLGG